MVIIGTYFIRMEVAAAFVESAASFTVIGRDPVPFLESFGEEVGKLMLDLHMMKGVQFCLEVDVKVCGINGALENVILKSDRTRH